MKKISVPFFKTSLLLLAFIIALLLSQTLALAAEKKNIPSSSSSRGTKPLPSPPNSSKQKLKTIIVDNYYPYTFVNPNGQPDGFSVDIIKAVAKVMEMDLDIAAGPWDKAMKALEKGEIDLLPMMAYSRERDVVFDFSVPHTIAYDAVFIRKGSPKIKDIESLKEKTIIVMKNDAAHGYLRSIGMTEKAKMIPVDSLPEALRLLSSGKGDYALMPKLVGTIEINKLGLTNLDTALLIEAYNRPFSFAVQHGNQTLLERLTQGLSIIKATGQYAAIYSKWFGALEPPGLSYKTVLKYISVVVGFFLIIGLILFFWNLSLKKQVTLRTRSLKLEIEEREKAEKSIQKLIERLNLATRSAGIGIWDWDIQKNELVWDERMYQLYGIREEDFSGAYEAWLSGVHPDDRLLSDRISKQALEGDIDYDTEFRVIWPDGSIHNLKANGDVIRDAQGKPVRMIGVNYDITESKRAEQQIMTSLKEKEILLKEIHHRVKNNLATIISILSLQAPYIEDEKAQEIFRECQNRVRTMSKIHSKLYQSRDFAHIDFGSYLQELTQELFLSYQIDPDAIEFETQIDTISLDINTALPLGLLLTELITNALKYAFPEGRKGKLQVSIQQENNQKVLTVADDGIGFPEHLDFQKTKSLGLQLVMGLVQQLQGTIKMKKDQGTTFTITFPAEK
jgi:PAS domain S-box-containing protein